jgi:hypothetical protein
LKKLPPFKAHPIDLWPATAALGLNALTVDKAADAKINSAFSACEVIMVVCYVILDSKNNE